MATESSTNREAQRARSRAYYLNNKTTIAARRSARNAENPSIVAAANGRYAAKRKRLDAEQLTARKEAAAAELAARRAAGLETERLAREALKQSKGSGARH